MGDVITLRPRPREARAAFDNTHVCPTLKADLAAEIGVIAKLCAVAAETAKGLGELRATVQLREHQGLLETLAAEVGPSPEGAA